MPTEMAKVTRVLSSTVMRTTGMERRAERSQRMARATLHLTWA